MSSQKQGGISGPFVIIAGLPKPHIGVYVVGDAEVTETYEGVVTVKGNLILRVPDLDTGANLVKLAQDALANVG